jgi:hypothetical protein
MLSTIRDKLLNVTKTVPLFSSNSDKGCVQCEVNLNAGSEILTHFQNEWEVLHNTNEDNAKKAAAAAATIAKITHKIDRDKQSLSVMTHLLTNSNLETEHRELHQTDRAPLRQFSRSGGGTAPFGGSDRQHPVLKT